MDVSKQQDPDDPDKQSAMTMGMLFKWIKDNHMTDTDWSKVPIALCIEGRLEFCTFFAVVGEQDTGKLSGIVFADRDESATMRPVSFMTRLRGHVEMEAKDCITVGELLQAVAETGASVEEAVSVAIILFSDEGEIVRATHSYALVNKSTGVLEAFLISVGDAKERLRALSCSVANTGVN